MRERLPVLATARGFFTAPFVVLLASLLPSLGHAQSNYATPYYFTTLAGLAGTSGYADGVGNTARFYYPSGVAVDAADNVYVVSTDTWTIRKISSFGVVTTVAGMGGASLGFVNGAGNAARFSYAYGIAVDPNGNLYVADSDNCAIRKITPAGVVTTLAGGSLGFADGAGPAARFNFPTGVAVDANSNVYVADSSNNAIRKIDLNGNVTTLAGGSKGNTDGTGSAAKFYAPIALAVDGAGNVFVADQSNNLIRKITAAGIVTTLAGLDPGAGALGANSGSTDGTGRAAGFDLPDGITVDGNGVVYVADSKNSTIRRITSSGVVTTLAGLTGSNGSADGTGNAARFNYPFGIAVDHLGNLYVGDSNNNTVRMSVFPPAFSTQPANVSVTPGSTATFTAGVTSNVPISYQWQRNGVPIPGATTATLNIANVQAANLGSYSVIATNLNTSTTSSVATLAFTLAPTFSSQPASQGVAPGGSVTFTVSVTSNVAITYQWLKDGVMIPGATNASLTVANVQAANLGNYSVVATTAAGSTTSSAAVLTFGTANVSRLSNLSIRSNAGTGAQTMIVGFVIGGAGTSGPKPLLIRGAGPALAIFGLNGFLADPSLSVYSGATVIASNDNWNGDAQVTAVGGQLGAFAFGSAASKDSALYSSTFTSGAFTAQVTGVGATTGVALAEIYDATPANGFLTSTPRLVNVSARTQVGTGADILITGFTIAGTTSKTLLIRAIGPSLSIFGVNGLLADPKLELYSGNTLIQSNDNWGGAANIVATAASVGAFALDGASKDAVLLVTLPPGSYTAQVTGVGATTGVALVEIYDVP